MGGWGGRMGGRSGAPDCEHKHPPHSLTASGRLTCLWVNPAWRAWLSLPLGMNFSQLFRTSSALVRT